jgi:hypothetical protein
MPANETVERLAAAAWIRYSNNGDDFEFSLRSQVSTQNRLLTTRLADFGLAPFIVLPFDREFTRRETTVHAQLIQTVQDTQPTPLSRQDYPWYLPVSEIQTAVPSPDIRLLACPMHMDWMGDPTNPTWLPFHFIDDTLSTVPDGFDLDIYNAIALVPRNVTEEVADTVWVDICVHIFKHPPIPPGVVTLVESTILVPIAS